MTFSRLSAIISLAIAAFQLADAAATKHAPNAACASQYIYYSCLKIDAMEINEKFGALL